VKSLAKISLKKAMKTNRKTSTVVTGNDHSSNTQNLNPSPSSSSSTHSISPTSPTAVSNKKINEDNFAGAPAQHELSDGILNGENNNNFTYRATSASAEAAVKKQKLPLWIEWNENDLNAEKWDSGGGGGGGGKAGGAAASGGGKDAKSKPTSAPVYINHKYIFFL
jgi:hypothetical protein